MFKTTAGCDDIEPAIFIEISNNIRKSFKPYFRCHTEQTHTNSDFHKFLNFLSSKEALQTDMVSLLHVSTCACLSWARYVNCLFCSYMNY